MNQAQNVLMSIYPQFADAILEGDKTVELRRRIAGLKSGSKIWIYATKPVGAILGCVSVADISIGPPEKMWAIFGQASAVDEAKFFSYFSGAPSATCISLINAQRGRPMPAAEFREARPRFHPPQVFLRITDEEAKFLASSMFPERRVS